MAIALMEPEAEVFGELIGSQSCLIGWPTVLESHLVLSSIPRKRGVKVLDMVLSATGIRTVAFDHATFGAARDAFDRFGRRTGHPARLNFGDCMAYAVARVHDVPLLYKGTDFAQTDIAAALP